MTSPVISALVNDGNSVNGNSVIGNSSPARTPRSGTPTIAHHEVNHKINERTGYTDVRFLGKEAQLSVVIRALQTKGFIPGHLVENEVVTLRSH
jgi:hypothetical protein